MGANASYEADTEPTEAPASPQKAMSVESLDNHPAPVEIEMGPPPVSAAEVEAAKDIKLLRAAMEHQSQLMRQRLLALEINQKKQKPAPIHAPGADVGKRWVGLLTDELCRRAGEETTSEVLGAQLAIAVKELIMQCPPGQ
ncbi:hypothetical protein DIPPA_01020 [Diplonema papillatum]|nr:hypothetical protein DIPPA_01020 [Diplonema papillatum]|eukprot:gene19601-30192_t